MGCVRMGAVVLFPQYINPHFIIQQTPSPVPLPANIPILKLEILPLCECPALTQSFPQQVSFPQIFCDMSTDWSSANLLAHTHITTARNSSLKHCHFLCLVASYDFNVPGNRVKPRVCQGEHVCVFTT